MNGGYIRRGKVLLLIVLVFGTFGVEKAHGANPVLADVRCVVVGMHMSTLNVPQQRDAGTVLSIYYLGRLDGRSVPADIDQLIEKEAGKMTPEDLRTEAVRCGKALSDKGQEIARITAALAAKSETSTITK